MCESHVSNPQTVGKCCSLLNSLLPPSLLPSMPPSIAHSFGWTALQTSNLACRSLMRVCVHVNAHACACLSAHRKSAQSVCQHGSAWNRHFLQTVSMPTPSPSQHTHIRIGNLFDSLSRTTKTPREGGRLLLVSFSLCLSLYPVCLFLFNTNADIFSICVLCVSIPSCDSSQFVSYDCQQDSSLT